MNNSQFRKLILDKDKDQDKDASSTAGAGGAKRSFMPMTPRTVRGGDVDFARQVRERHAALQPPAKKFKSHAPKGSKFASGYVDRAKAREEAETEDEKGARITALEEQMKLGQISLEMFERLRDEITGGDISSTHLVKGLDRRLLERVKRGEDVLGNGSSGTEAAETEPEPDVDEALDKLGEQEVQAVQREKAEKKGVMAPPPIAGKKRSRNEIMAELKAQREAAKLAKAPALDTSKWRKVGEKERARIEIDAKGREVLITVDEDGVVKKKVRKVRQQTESEEGQNAALAMPDASKPVLGADADIPQHLQAPKAAPEDSDDDIFAGVGTEYNPLGDDVSDDDDVSDEDDTAPPPKILTESSREREAESPSASEEEEGEVPPSPPSEPDKASPDSVEPKAAPARRNYFGDNKSAETVVEGDRFAGIENVLKKAARRGEDDDTREGEDEEAYKARLAKRAKMLATQDRDLEDMDMGFGSSRFEDEADIEGEGQKIRLSEWKGKVGGDEEGWDEGGGKGEKRKRKPKKRKGDGNNMADVMRVIEGRKNAKG